MTIFVASLVMAVIWVIFSRQFTPQAFAVGIILGAVSFWLVEVNTGRTQPNFSVKPASFPSQVVAFVRYMAMLFWDIILSGVAVARLALARDVKSALDTQFSEISTQDETNNELISALSAHAITITPGSLVVDYTEIDGQKHMLVHVLDAKNTSKDQLIADQAKRVASLKRILGLWKA